MKKRVWVAIYIFQGLQITIFKCGIVHYTLFPESKINILHLKIIKTQSRLVSYSYYGIQKQTFFKKRLFSVVSRDCAYGRKGKKCFTFTPMETSGQFICRHLSNKHLTSKAKKQGQSTRFHDCPQQTDEIR